MVMMTTLTVATSQFSFSQVTESDLAMIKDSRVLSD